MLHLLGAHQLRNAACAIEAVQQLNQGHFKVSQAAIQEGLSKAYWPGRFEQIGPFILDGAHNIQGIESLLAAIDAYFHDTPLTIVFGVMADKDSLSMQKRLEKRATRMIFTQVDHPRALDQSIMLERSAHPRAEAMDLKDIVNLQERTLIAGSLYVISALRRQIKETINA